MQMKNDLFFLKEMEEYINYLGKLKTTSIWNKIEDDIIMEDDLNYMLNGRSSLF